MPDDVRHPPKGGAPEAPPLPEVPLVWERRSEGRSWGGYLLALLAGGGAVWKATVRSGINDVASTT